MTTSEQVGQRIREAREEKGLTQGQLGELLERPRTHAAVSDIERGRTKLNIDEISEFARLLDRPLAYFTGSGASVVYQRSVPGASLEQRRQHAAAVESFKAHARRALGGTGER